MVGILVFAVNYFNFTVSNNLYKVPGIKNVLYREFPDGPVVRTPCIHCHGPGSTPGRGTKIS